MSPDLRAVLLGGAAALALIAPCAYAQEDNVSPVVEQDSEAPQGDEADRRMSTVIVTSGRRTQLLSEVPSNLMAYGADTLENQGVESLADLSRVVPGLAQANFDPARGGWGGALPVLRGVNANRLATVSPNVSAPTISTYYGNALLPVALGLSDIDRIEVLRGPQGTLYGSGSMAGTLQIVPASPDLDETFLTAKGGLSTTENAGDLNYSAESILNWAISDRLGLRLVAGRNKYAGYIDEARLIALTGKNTSVPGPDLSTPANTVGALPTDPETFTTASNVNDSEMDYYRAKVRFEPTDRLMIELTYDEQNFESGGPSVENPKFAGLGDYTATNRLQAPAERKLQLGAVDIEADFGFATLAVNASAYDDEVDTVRDWTQVARTYVGPFYFAPYAIAEPPRLQGTAFESSTSSGQTLEARVTSNGDNRFNWMAGLFYTDQDQDFYSEYWMPGITEYSDAVGNFWPYRPPFFPDAAGVPDDLIWDFSRLTSFNDTSFFVDVDYDLTERWEIAGGIRVFKQEFDARSVSLLYSCNFFCSLDGADPRGANIASSSETFEDSVFRLSTNYRLQDDLRVYFNYAEGFRRGGANAVATTGLFAEPENLLTFEPDKVKSYELGLRGQAYGFNFTTDVFFMDWDGPQIDGLTPSGNWYAVVNAEAARNIGFEFEANGNLSENVDIAFGYAYVNAELSKDFSVPAAVRPAQGFEGDRLPGVPEHSLTASLNWYQPELLVEWDGQFNVSISYRSDVWTGFESNGNAPGSRNPSFLLDGFAITNAFYAIENGDIRITAFADNVFNEKGITAINPVIWSGDTINAGYNQFVMRPRTVGVRAAYTF
jgi:iron complex outermembrane receptor protein